MLGPIMDRQLGDNTRKIFKYYEDCCIKFIKIVGALAQLVKHPGNNAKVVVSSRS